MPVPDSGSAGPDTGVQSLPDGGVTCNDVGQCQMGAPSLAGVCPGPDRFEPNQTRDTAAAIGLSAPFELERFAAEITTGNDDYFQFTTPKGDPANVTVRYTVAGVATTELQLFVSDATQTTVASDTSARTTPSQTLQANWQSSAQGNYFIQLTSNSATCQAYDLSIDAYQCTDQYEDNDTSSTPAQITLTNSKATVLASIQQGDDDWYTFTTAKADPVQTQVSYTRPAVDTTALQLFAQDATGTTVASDTSARSMPSQTLSTLWESVAGAAYRMQVTSNGANVCAPYQMAINSIVCTDAFEDNDTAQTPSTLPKASSQNATISSLDPDFYKLTSPAATGSCTVTYTVAGTSSQQLQIFLTDATGTTIASDTAARTGASQTLTTSWVSGQVPVILQVVGSVTDCQAYTVSCQ